MFEPLGSKGGSPRAKARERTEPRPGEKVSKHFRKTFRDILKI